MRREAAMKRLNPMPCVPEDAVVNLIKIAAVETANTPKIKTNPTCHFSGCLSNLIEQST